MKKHKLVKVIKHLIIAFFLLLLSGCLQTLQTDDNYEEKNDLSLTKTPMISEIIIKEELFNEIVLEGVNDINDSITITRFPEEIYQDEIGYPELNGYIVINNSAESVKIPMENLMVGFYFDEELEIWTELKLKFTNLSGKDYIDLQPFNDWMNAKSLNLRYISTMLGNKTTSVRVVIVGEKTNDKTTEPIAAWLDIPWDGGE